MKLYTLAVLAALVLAGTVGAPVEGAPTAGEGPRLVSATAFPSARGLSEVTVAVATGERPWRGTVTVSGASAKASVTVTLPAMGQRIVRLPIWLDGPDRMSRVWLDETLAGEVRPPSTDDTQVLAVAADTHVPAVWRVYPSRGLLVVTEAQAMALQPSQSAALDAWVRWGGSVGLVRSTARAATTTSLGAGTAIVAPTADDAHATWQRSTSAGDPGVARLLDAWEQLKPTAALPILPDGRPGTALLAVGALYVGALAGCCIVAARIRRFRAAGPELVLLLVAVGALAMWSVASAGGSAALNVQEAVVIAVQPGGAAATVAAVARLRAHRVGVTRWHPAATAAYFYEVPSGRDAQGPTRAVRRDDETGAWQRSWAAGETAIVRAGGTWPDPGFRVTAHSDGSGWEVTNVGSRTLRHAVLIGASGARRLPDVTPAARVTADRASGWEAGPPPEPWSRLFPGQPAPKAPVLIGILDPPVTTLRFAGADVTASSETFLVVPLGAPLGAPPSSRPRP